MQTASNLRPNPASAVSVLAQGRSVLYVARVADYHTQRERNLRIGCGYLVIFSVSITAAARWEAY